MTTIPNDLVAMTAAHRAAGMCAVGRALGLAVREVLVHLDLKERPRGLCFFQPAAEGDDPIRRAASLATVAYSGSLAEVRFRASTGQSLRVMRITKTSVKEMFRLIRSHVADPDRWLPVMVNAQARGQELVETATVNSAIVTIATELLSKMAFQERPVLTGAQIEELLSR